MRTHPVAVTAVLVAAALALSGCAGRARMARPAENITGTYELSGFRIMTTVPEAPPVAPGAPDNAAPYFTNLTQGATTTEKEVASYSGTLKVGRNTWSRQVTINDKSVTESGDYTLTFTGPNQAQLALTTPTGEQKTLRLTFEGVAMTVDYPTVTLPDGSTIHETFMWKKVSG